MAGLIQRFLRAAITLLLVLVVVNLLIGVFLRYVMVDITNWLDMDPIRFTWVEEVGEFTLAWLTLVGAALGVRQRTHFTLHVLPLGPALRRQVERFNHVLIAAFGLVVAWHGVGLCAINLGVKSPGLEISLAILYASSVLGGVLIALYAVSMIVAPPPVLEKQPLIMLTILLLVGLLFVVLVVLSMPIVFALGIAGVVGLWAGGYPMQMLPSSLVSGSQSWVLLAIPAFVFAGGVMERCGMAHALVDFARALVGWVKGGLGMSVLVVAYFFSDICGSKMAEVSALSSTLMPPLKRAGYKAEDAASLIASGTAMGMLVPPAIFMIVIAQVTNTSAVALFLAGFIPAATILACLMVLVWFRARRYDWPVDSKPSVKNLLHSFRRAAVPLVIPVVILGGFFMGVFTATEAGAVVAGYAFVVAKFYYRNVSFREMGRIALDSGILTAAVVFLLAVASIFQYLMGVSGVPKLMAEALGPLKDSPWLFLLATAAISMLFGMVLEGLPAAVVLIPVVFPIAEAMGINPIHFNIVQTAAVGIGLFLPPMGVGLLMALKFADVPVGRHAKTYWPYLLALMVGLLLIILIPELCLTLPRRAGLIR